MLRLAEEKCEKARRFIFEQARTLERSLYGFHFENASKEDVLDELAKFQNEDGGFGHGLESDLRTSVSTTMATSVGFQVLREVGAKETCPIVQSAVQFLLKSYDAERKAWPIIVPEVNNAPHAPWWHFGEDRPARWKESLANPRPEILGYLYDYQGLVSGSMLSSLTEDVVAYLEKLPETMEMHDLLCYARLMAMKSLPDDVKRKMRPRLEKAVDLTVTKDESQWGGYGLKPVVLAPCPVSPFAEQLHISGWVTHPCHSMLVMLSC